MTFLFVDLKWNGPNANIYIMEGGGLNNVNVSEMFKVNAKICDLSYFYFLYDL